jgi:hypothetical protein
MFKVFDEITINLKDKIFQLITLHEKLKEDNKKKIEECKNLKEELIKIKNLNIDLEKKYETLKLAKIIELTSEDTHKTKLQLNKIVREIDNCIALLNN